MTALWDNVGYNRMSNSRLEPFTFGHLSPLTILCRDDKTEKFFLIVPYDFEVELKNVFEQMAMFTLCNSIKGINQKDTRYLGNCFLQLGDHQRFG